MNGDDFFFFFNTLKKMWDSDPTIVFTIQVLAK